MVILYRNTEIDENDIWFGIDTIFERICKLDWFEHPLVPIIVELIDKPENSEGLVFSNPIFNVIGPGMLSKESKTLITALANPDKLYPISNFGNNCYKAIDLVSKEIDINFVRKSYLPKLDANTDVKVMATGEIIKGKDLFVKNILAEHNYLKPISFSILDKFTGITYRGELLYKFNVLCVDSANRRFSICNAINGNSNIDQFQISNLLCGVYSRDIMKDIIVVVSDVTYLRSNINECYKLLKESKCKYLFIERDWLPDVPIDYRAFYKWEISGNLYTLSNCITNNIFL